MDQISCKPNCAYLVIAILVFVKCLGVKAASCYHLPSNHHLGKCRAPHVIDISSNFCPPPISRFSRLHHCIAYCDLKHNPTSSRENGLLESCFRALPERCLSGPPTKQNCDCEGVPTMQAPQCSWCWCHSEYGHLRAQEAPC